MRHKLLICSCGGDDDVGDDGDGDDDDLPMYSVHPWCSFHVLHCDRFALSENTTCTSVSTPCHRLFPHVLTWAPMLED